jgi:amino acid transporter
MSSTARVAAPRDEDSALLASLGYSQDLQRRMSRFSNFAVSFAIICILAGGITAFPTALGAGGGLTVSIGWLVGASFAGVVALAMAQIASAYPTAGGLYHWGSTLGGRGFGWVTGWFNLLGLVLVCGSVVFGLYDPFFKVLLMPLLGVDTSRWGAMHQIVFVAAVMFSQALLNHLGVGLTTRLVDLSGYLIFVVTLLLTGSLWVWSTVPVDFSRLVTFTNFTGTAGSMWPRTDHVVLAFLSGLLLTVYTITGFDASAHTAEETHDAARNVPRGIVASVLWSGLFGFVLVSTFVIVMPNIAEGVKQGSAVFSSLLAPLPPVLRGVLVLALFVINYLCGLAGLMSTSRMMYAFARDGGLPASERLGRVDPATGSPIASVWVCAIAAFTMTLYADAFAVLSAGCVVFLYISYVMPIAAGAWAEGRTWTRKGPFDLGAASRPVAALAVLGALTLIFVGVQPPNEKVGVLVLGLSGFLALFWWVFGERRRFKGTPAALSGRPRQGADLA